VSDKIHHIPDDRTSTVASWKRGIRQVAAKMAVSAQPHHYQIKAASVL
jgi:hypothetical protein